MLVNYLRERIYQYYWKNFNIYLVLFWASLTNNNQPYYYKWWFWWTTFECEFVNIIEEISTFTSYYFELHLWARINCITRNDGASELPSSTNLLIFCHLIRPLSKKPIRRRYLTHIEFKQTHIYMIFNYDEFRPLLLYSCKLFSRIFSYKLNLVTFL